MGYNSEEGRIGGPRRVSFILRQPHKIVWFCGSCLDLSGTSSPADITRRIGRYDAPKGQHAEESLAAGIATIGRKSEPSFGGNQSAVINTIARNVLEIEVSAPGAMRETREGNCNSPCIKSAIAGMASPGL